MESQQNQNAQIWRKKIERCTLALKAQIKKNVWYVDSGCSTHMTEDKNKFISLKEGKNGTVSFGNDGSKNIIVTSIVKLGGKDAKAEDVLLIENINHSLLSVSQICDQGHTLLFDSKKCEIRREKPIKIVATSTRTPNDIYTLDETIGKGCFLEKEDESWLQHKWMGQINFDNLVRISKKQAMRDMSQISKPSSTTSKHCTHGKHTRVEFKTKEHSTSKLLELIHIDLCGPTKTK